MTDKVLRLPGAEAMTEQAANEGTQNACQLRVRVAALEAEVARLRALLDDPGYMRDRAVKLLARSRKPVL